MKVPSRFMNRRNFANSSLLAGAALVSDASGVLGAGRPERRIRTGVIGCGSVSNAYLPVLTSSPFVEVVSLCDISAEPTHPAVLVI